MINWITIPSVHGAYSVSDPLLVGVRVIKCCREAQAYNKSDSVGNLKFVHNRSTGSISFEDPFKSIDLGVIDKHEKVYVLYEKI